MVINMCIIMKGRDKDKFFHIELVGLFLFSPTVGCKMKFGIYVPDKAEKERVPLLIFLSGLFEILIYFNKEILLIL